jgi:protein TonB
LQREISQLRAPDSQMKIIEPPPSPKDLNSARKLEMATSVIEPPPDVKLNPRAINAPAPSVIEPPPAANVARNIGSLNMGHLTATVAAPKIEVPEQKVIALQPGGAAVSKSLARSGGGAAVLAPPIAPIGGVNAGPSTGQLISLNAHPAIPNGPISVPPGRRSGEFAVGPEGTADAPATPDIKAGGNGSGGNATDNNKLPSGISVGDAPGAPPKGSVVAAGDPAQARDTSRDKETVMSAARPPRIGEIPRRPSNTSVTAPRSVEDRVFGAKQIYTLALNTPNLTSSGGSWIIRFAQLEEDHTPAPLSAPVATRTVDPAYPADLMRDGYEGTVVLYAVIHKDGTVGEVRILRGVQGRLDESAKLALSRWKFRPGTKNGQAVDLEAVVQIPFKASRIGY